MKKERILRMAEKKEMIFAGLMVANIVGAIAIAPKLLAYNQEKYYTITPGTPGWEHVELVAFYGALLVFTLTTLGILLAIAGIESAAWRIHDAEARELTEEEAAARLKDEQAFLENVLGVYGCKSIREYSEKQLRDMRARYIEPALAEKIEDRYLECEELWDNLLEAAEQELDSETISTYMMQEVI